MSVNMREYAEYFNIAYKCKAITISLQVCSHITIFSGFRTPLSIVQATKTPKPWRFMTFESDLRNI